MTDGDKILDGFLREKTNFSEKRRTEFIGKLKRHEDLHGELLEYIGNGENYGESQLVTACGYTAKFLAENYPLSVVGAYNYMIYLREDTENALSDLERGLPRK